MYHIFMERLKRKREHRDGMLSEWSAPTGNVRMFRAVTMERAKEIARDMEASGAWALVKIEQEESR